MTFGNIPEAEVDLDDHLVRSLLDAQHPDLADLELSVLASGWDNVNYRLGDDLIVRLPRRAMSAALVEHEQRCLPELARHLPLPIPVPVRVGRPALGYPWSWSIVRWLPGETAAATPPTDERATAAQLGAFLRALHTPAPPDAPVNPYRGGPLSDREPAVLDRIAQLGHLIDGPATRAAWDRYCAVPRGDDPATWIHGDLHPKNLLVVDGRIAAVIDFGDVCGGDRATDLSVAWMLLPAEHRPAFRTAAGDVDDDTWARARGWAVGLALAYLASSGNDAVLGDIGRRTLDAVLHDPQP